MSTPTRSAELSLAGMTCESCERHVAGALTRAGAEHASANFRRGLARFEWPERVAEVDLQAAVAEAGYTPGALRVEEPGPPRPAGGSDFDYDLVVLGAGSAAFAAAIKAPRPAAASRWSRRERSAARA